MRLRPESIAEAEQASLLFDQLRPILAGHSPGIQGAVLAQATAAWLAGHPFEIRERLLAMHSEAVLRFIPHMHAIIRGD